MLIKEMMERVGTNESGRFYAYLTDALLEVNTIATLKESTAEVSIVKDQRAYDLTYDQTFITDVRVKGHQNDDGKYRSIPRLASRPLNDDADMT
tara:strand:- start:7258 stop:7539 length:282 start_codon:yes stop_codon:yes gene_type:complete